MLKNHTALITGASSGIGFATALRLAEEGCNLNLVARRQDRLTELKAIIEKKFSTKVTFIAGDITRDETIQKMTDQGFFESDILVNNAGAAIGRDEVKDLKTADLKSVIELNVIAAFRMIQSVVPSMLKKGHGDIVSLGSIAAVDPYAGGATYCATKAALKTFHEALRQEVYGKNIRVMMVSPGMVETEFSLARFNQDQEKAQATYRGMTPLTSDDVAREIVHLLTNPRHATVAELVLLATDQGGATLVRRQA